MTPSWPAGAHRRFSLLVNPRAGRGRARRDAALVERMLRAAGADVTVCRADSLGQMRTSAVEAVETAQQSAAADEPHAVVAVGGDGTVHTVLQAVAGTEVPLGVVAAGSGDDAARAWGLPRARPVDAAAVLLHGQPSAVDLPEARTDAGHRVAFGTVLAAGFDAVVSERALALSGVPSFARYLVAVAIELRRFRPLPYDLVLDGAPLHAEGMLVAVANSASYGGGMLVCPDARPDDGLLDVLLLDPMPTRAFVRVFPQVYRGGHLSHPAVHMRRARSVRLDTARVTAFADGEPVGALPLTVTVRAGGLTVLRRA